VGGNGVGYGSAEDVTLPGFRRAHPLPDVSAGADRGRLDAEAFRYETMVRQV
jgi:hypothetical protein